MDDLRELEDDESRDSRSRTTCGMSTRCACANWTVRSLRYVLSFVRCGEGERLRSSRLSFLEHELAGLSGGVELESMDGFRRRVGARTTALYASLLLMGTCFSSSLREKRRKMENFLDAGCGVVTAVILPICGINPLSIADNVVRSRAQACLIRGVTKANRKKPSDKAQDLGEGFNSRTIRNQYSALALHGVRGLSRFI